MTTGSHNSHTLADDIVHRGTRVYEDRLRSILEPRHNGEYVVIDVDTGEFEVDTDHASAMDRAASKRPGALFYHTRVGSPTLGRIGARTRTRTP